MTSGGLAELDFIEELRLRRWARENYVPRGLRQKSWHPVVHEEMAKKETEQVKAEPEHRYRQPEAVFARSYR
jgi:hypothetical protein